jgi:hypothetical protein
MRDRSAQMGLACSVTALAVVTVLALCRSPVKIAASRLAVGMTTQEVALALRPEIEFHPFLAVSWQSVAMTFPSGLRLYLTWNDGWKLTGWDIGRPIPRQE